MKEGEGKIGGKRVIITSVTTFSLFALPYANIPEELLFVVPGIIEFIAFVILFVWVAYQSGRISKKKFDASESLRRSIDDEIEKLTVEVERARNPSTARLLEKQLAELYKERAEQSAVRRKRLKDDIQKYDDHGSRIEAEKETIKTDLVRKIGEELDKAGEVLGKE